MLAPLGLPTELATYAAREGMPSLFVLGLMHRGVRVLPLAIAAAMAASVTAVPAGRALERPAAAAAAAVAAAQSSAAVAVPTTSAEPASSIASRTAAYASRGGRCRACVGARG